METLQFIGNETTIPNVTSIEGDVLSFTRTVRLSDEEKAGRYVIRGSLDYEGMTRQQLMLQAARPSIIKIQQQIRDSKTVDAEKWDNQKFMVVDLLIRGRVKKSPLDQARKALDSMSTDERATLLRELQDEANS